MAEKDMQLLAHLMRRAGFGATRAELEKYSKIGYEATPYWRKWLCSGAVFSPQDTLKLFMLSLCLIKYECLNDTHWGTLEPF